MELSQDRKDDGGRTPSGGGDDKELHKNPDDDGDEGTRQPYNCAFCKRGFPTAQALGGHMNVHRKDRGRATPAITSTGYGTLVAFTGYGQTHPASGSEASTAAGGACSMPNGRSKSCGCSAVTAPVVAKKAVPEIHESTARRMAIMAIMTKVRRNWIWS